MKSWLFCIGLFILMFVHLCRLQGVVADEWNLQRIDVPANQPDQWPKGNWTAIPREEFAEWLKKIDEKKSRATRTRLHTADYSLKVVDDRLEGSFQLSLAGKPLPSGELIELTPVSLAVKKLSWASGRANVMGLGGNERQYLWIDGTKSEVDDVLHGECVVSGTRLPQSLFFRLGLFPADLTEVRLQLPDGYELSTSTGVLTPEESGRDGPEKTMLLRMAGQAECELTLTRQQDQETQASHLIYEEDVTALIREDELRFLTTLSIETPERVFVRELKIRLPENFEVISATLGADTNLPWKRSPSPAADSTTVLTLPGPMTGKLRAIRLEGILPGNVLPLVSIPQVVLKDATLLRGRATISVISPLQVRNVEMEGYRESGPVTVTADGEVFTYDRQEMNSSLKLEIRRPIPRFTASSTTILYGSLDHWRIQSHVDWQVSSGALQQAVVSVPPGWEITEVTGEDEASRLSDWEVQRDATRSSLILMEFALTASPGQPRRVRISARRSFSSSPGKLAIPAIKPTNAESTDYLLAVKTESAGKASLADNSRYESASVPPSIDPRIVRDIQRFSSSLKPEDFLWYRATDPQVTGDLEFSSNLVPLKMTAQVLVDASEALLNEHYLMKVTSEGPPPKELLVFLSEPGDDINWYTCEGEVTSRLKAQRASSRVYTEWGYPETGELWLLTPEAWSEGQLMILGSRQRPKEAATIGLVYMPQASQFSGQVFVDVHSLQGDEIVTTLISSDIRPDENLLKVESILELHRGRPSNKDQVTDSQRSRPQITKSPEAHWKTFEYRSLDSRLSLSSPITLAEMDDPVPAEMLVTAQLPTTLGGTGQIQIEYRVPENRKARLFDVKLPDGWRLKAVRCDGTTLPVEMVNRPISNEASIRWNCLELEIDGPVAQQWLRQEIELPLPRTPLTILGGTLTLQIPPRVDASAVSTGWYAHQQTEPAWTERWFGPLGRSHSATIYDPLSRSVSKIIAGKEATTLLANSQDRQPREASQESLYQWKTLLFSRPESDLAITTGTEKSPVSLRLTFFNRNDAQQANWTILLGTILAGVMVVACFPRKGVMALFLLGVLCAAWHPWCGLYEQSFAGSFLTGILLLLVIPPHFWTYQLSSPPSNTVPSGSTLSYRLPAQGLMVLLSAGGWWRLIVLGSIACLQAPSFAAQQQTLPAQNAANVEVPAEQDLLAPRERSAENVRIPATTIDPDKNIPVRDEDSQLRKLLVPVDSKGQPAEGLPLVYLHPATAARLKALAVDVPAEIGTLLGPSRIEGAWGPGKQVLFELTCGIWVLPKASAPEIQILVPSKFLAGRDSVLLGGIPAKLQRSTTSADVLHLSLPVDSSAQTPVYLELKLKLRPAHIESNQGFSQIVPLLGTLQTELTWPELEPNQVRFSTGLSMTADADSRGFQQWPGPLRRLLLQPKIESHPDRVTPATTHAEEPVHREVVDVKATIHPDFVQISHQSRIWLKNEIAQPMTLPVPKGFVVRSIKSDRLLNWYREEGSESDLIHLELRSNSEPTLSVDSLEKTGEWVGIEVLAVIPNSTSKRATLWLDRWKSTIGLPVYECDYQLTTDCSTEFRLSSPVIHAVPSAREGLTGRNGKETDVKSLVVSASKLVSRSDKPFHIEFALSQAVPLLKMIEWRQLCTIVNQRMEVDYIATIETDDYPLFSHRWEIDRRLQIENVSITQGGAERLVRVSDERRRDQGRILTTLLSNTLKGMQTVHIHGSISLRNQRSVPLPKFELVGASSIPGTLVVRSLPQLAVTIEGMIEKASGTESLFPEVKGIRNSDRAAFKSFAYRWNMDQSPRLTLTPILTSLPATTLTMVNLNDAQRIGLKTWIHIDVAAHGMTDRRFEIELPTTLRGSHLSQLTSEWGEIRELEAGSGRFELVRSPSRLAEKPLLKDDPQTAPDDLILLCESDLPIPRDQQWTIPLPTVDKVSYQDHLVVVDPVDADVKLLKTVAGKTFAQLPVWLAKSVGNSFSLEMSPLLSTGQEPPVLFWGTAPAVISQAQAQHAIWFRPGVAVSGVSYFRIDRLEASQRDEAAVRIQVAAEVSPDLVIINNRLRPVSQIEGGQIPLEFDTSKPCVARLFWHRRGKSPAIASPWGMPVSSSIFGNHEITVPHLEGVAPQAHHVLLVPPAEQQIMTDPRAFSRADEQTPMSVLQFLPPLSVDAAFSRQKTDNRQPGRGQQKLTLQSLLMQEDVSSKPMIEPFIREEIPYQSSYLARSFSDPRGATWMQMETFSKQTFGYRQSTSIWLWICWSTGLLLVGGYLFSRLSPVGLRDWLIEHPHAAYALLGLVWWLAFEASALGFAVCIGALASSLWKRFRRWKTHPQPAAA